MIKHQLEAKRGISAGRYARCQPSPVSCEVVYDRPGFRGLNTSKDQKAICCTPELNTDAANLMESKLEVSLAKTGLPGTGPIRVTSSTTSRLFTELKVPNLRKEVPRHA